MVLQLVDERRLDLDKAIATYLTQPLLAYEKYAAWRCRLVADLLAACRPGPGCDRQTACYRESDQGQ